MTDTDQNNKIEDPLSKDNVNDVEKEVVAPAEQAQEQANGVDKEKESKEAATQEK